MQTLYAIDLSIPLYQVSLLLALSTLVFLVGKAKLALLINYLFVFYWGYWLSREKIFTSNVFEMNSFTMGYVGFGLIIVILALIGFINRTG
jgi:hypothetical protein